MKAARGRRKASKVTGPKTAKAAARAGHTKVSVDFVNLAADEKKKWTTRRAATGERINLVGTYRDGPSLGGGVIRCYYDPNTGNYDDCHKIA